MVVKLERVGPSFVRGGRRYARVQRDAVIEERSLALLGMTGLRLGLRGISALAWREQGSRLRRF